MSYTRQPVYIHVTPHSDAISPTPAWIIQLFSSGGCVTIEKYEELLKIPISIEYPIIKSKSHINLKKCCLFILYKVYETWTVCVQETVDELMKFTANQPVEEDSHVSELNMQLMNFIQYIQQLKTELLHNLSTDDELPLSDPVLLKMELYDCLYNNIILDQQRDRNRYGVIVDKNIELSVLYQRNEYPMAHVLQLDEMINNEVVWTDINNMKISNSMIQICNNVTNEIVIYYIMYLKYELL